MAETNVKKTLAKWKRFRIFMLILPCFNCIPFWYHRWGKFGTFLISAHLVFGMYLCLKTLNFVNEMTAAFEADKKAEMEERINYGGGKIRCQ